MKSSAIFFALDDSFKNNFQIASLQTIMTNELMWCLSCSTLKQCRKKNTCIFISIQENCSLYLMVKQIHLRTKHSSLEFYKIFIISFFCQLISHHFFRKQKRSSITKSTPIAWFWNGSAQTTAPQWNQMGKRQNFTSHRNWWSNKM